MPEMALEVSYGARAADDATGNVATGALIDVRKTRPILEQIANKWAILIMTVLCAKPSRFNTIMRHLDGITHKALADALKRLERNGLVRREVLPTSPVGVEYSITPLGRSLQRPFAALYDWVLAYGPEMAEAQVRYDGLRDEQRSPLRYRN